MLVPCNKSAKTAGVLGALHGEYRPGDAAAVRLLRGPRGQSAARLSRGCLLAPPQQADPQEPSRYFLFIVCTTDIIVRWRHLTRCVFPVKVGRIAWHVARRSQSGIHSPNSTHTPKTGCGRGGHCPESLTYVPPLASLFAFASSFPSCDVQTVRRRFIDGAVCLLPSSYFTFEEGGSAVFSQLLRFWFRSVRGCQPLSPWFNVAVAKTLSKVFF